ncbi:plasmid partitioning protein RepB [Methylobacterium sp. WSM2598]|uniref:plasmid partitioning protein RepB n=1 Tax=Methylobacterium sp. WSM2598 TaxID=398261 RepID=UPI000380F45A|nr:plasmid partitioning protein RepB [Methylobacterium sp. WSM2598]
MGRKNLLTSLNEPELPAGNSSLAAVFGAGQGAAALGGLGAIGAVTKSIEKLQSQAVAELEPELIDASFITDRLETDQASHEALVRSIREHGQQVPILVRPNPEAKGRYQIAYGRRRLRAALELKRPIRALIKPLSDQELVVAQGQENSARTDLSFIEKALFAAKLEEGGFVRETIMASLSVDKTGLSRLISAAVKVPRDIIEAIGPAPKAGRDRWLELASRLEGTPNLARARGVIGSEDFASKDTDARFLAVLNAAATAKKPKSARPTVWKAEDGTRVAAIREDAKILSLAIDKRSAGAFGSFLVEQLPQLYAAFKEKGKG